MESFHAKVKENGDIVVNQSRLVAFIQCLIMFTFIGSFVAFIYYKNIYEVWVIVTVVAISVVFLYAARSSLYTLLLGNQLYLDKAGSQIIVNRKVKASFDDISKVKLIKSHNKGTQYFGLLMIDKANQEISVGLGEDKSKMRKLGKSIAAMVGQELITAKK